MAKMTELHELVANRQVEYFKLVDAQQQVGEADHAIKRALIDMGATEALTIQWGKLRKMVRNS